MITFTFFNVFNVFLKYKTRDFLRFFALLHTFLEQWVGALNEDARLTSDVNLWGCISLNLMKFHIFRDGISVNGVGVASPLSNFSA